MSKISWSELFPTNVSFVIFISYILLFSIQGVLVTASQSANNEYAYDVTTVVLLTEFVKLVASALLYCKDNSIHSLIVDVGLHWKVLALYLIPAFLYSLYNNLAFLNLSQFDPTTYNILLQFRVVITAILFQLTVTHKNPIYTALLKVDKEEFLQISIIFKRKLSKKQWFSLVLLTLGCMAKQFNFGDVPTVSANTNYKAIAITGILFIFIQMLCSCFAGVYNEHLLKSAGADVNIFIQNVFMYLDSILCNAVLLLLQGKLLTAISMHNFELMFNYRVLLVVANNATVGIITSFFLKTLNSILKVFASSLELVLTALFAYVLLSVPIHLNTIISIFTVLVAVYVYSQNPVTNLPVRRPSRNEDQDKLLEDV